MNWQGCQIRTKLGSTQTALLLVILTMGGCRTAPSEGLSAKGSTAPGIAADSANAKAPEISGREVAAPSLRATAKDSPKDRPQKGVGAVRTVSFEDSAEPDALSPGDAADSQSGAKSQSTEKDARPQDAAHPAPGRPLLLPAAQPDTAERTTFPVDLLTALRLADAQNLTIAIARNQLEIAYAIESRAQVLWLPDIEFSPGYQINSGEVQRAIGEIIETNRNSLRVRGGPMLSVDAAEAIYAPLVAHQQVNARAAGINVARNKTLAEVGEAYFDMLAAFSAVSIAVETREHAERLAALTREMLESGLGLASDAARAQTELQIRQQLEILARAQTVTTSAALARRLQMDARVQFAPIEVTIVPVTLVPIEARAEGLVEVALQNRPELAEQRALVGAADWSAEQARMLPLIPQLVIGYQAGGFGGGYTGGPQGFFGRFGDRTDLEASALWELKNFGLGNRYQIRQRELEVTGRQLALRKTIFQVMEEVVSDHQNVAARAKQVDPARAGVRAAIESYDQNIARIEGGAGLPIEALQALQALQKARTDYLQAVTEFNRAQFRLFADLGYAAVDAGPLGNVQQAPE
jgi:outer membrane protein TolC